MSDLEQRLQEIVASFRESEAAETDFACTVADVCEEAADTIAAMRGVVEAAKRMMIPVSIPFHGEIIGVSAKDHADLVSALAILHRSDWYLAAKRDVEAILNDQSIVIPQDAAVWELLAKWRDAPSNTASAMSDEELADWIRENAESKGPQHARRLRLCCYCGTNLDDGACDCTERSDTDE